MSFESFDQVTGPTREALIGLLYALGDDEFILGHRNSEWTGLGPILEEDIAFSSMAQDEMGHALTYYRMLHELGEPDPDAIAFDRPAHEFRCCSLVSIPTKRDWALTIIRNFLYDAQESVRLMALSQGSLKPLADVARKLRSEEKYHLMHGRSWVLRLGDATTESHKKMQTALDIAYPHALGMFEPADYDAALLQAGIVTDNGTLRHEWESAVSPVFAEAGLKIPENAAAQNGGRVGRQPAALGELLKQMRLVHDLEPQGAW